MRYVPKGDLVERSVCNACELIHYQNPKVLVGSIVDCNDKILLCKRATEPRIGFWTLPSGYMENDETVLEAAIRETEEETKVSLNKMHLYIVFSCPDINQVYFIFRGISANDCASTTEESSETSYFTKENIPWNKLSYSIMNKALDLYFRDKEHGRYQFRMLDINGCEPDTD